MCPSIALVLLAACAGPASVSPQQPLGVADHRAEADRHDQRAARHAAAAEHAEDRNGYACSDTVLADQLTSGGERLELAVPCWNTDAEANFEHRRAGCDSRYMGYDPSLVPGVSTKVAASDGRITVELRAAAPDVAAVVAGRTEALIADFVTPFLP